MNKRVKLVIAVMIALCVAFSLGACHKSSVQEQISGKLTQALDDKIVIDSEGETVEIRTNDSTLYDLNGAEQLSINDIVDVTYHTTSGKKYADSIQLVEHVQEEQVFEGTVTEVTDKSVTVTGKNMTVTFVRNDFSETEGDLSVGSNVRIVYTGDISEYPYASKINATAGKKETKTISVSGVVSEFTETSMLLAIDSANSYRFTIDKNTKVTGVDKYVRTGDTVTVTFQGELAESPVAMTIDITKKAEEYRQSVNGTIDKIRDDYIVLNTSKKAYIIGFDKYTKFTGDKAEEGCKAEVTYRGKLGGDCTAIIVYCVKKTPDPVKYTVTFTDGNGKTLKSEKVVSGKSATAPAAPSRSGYTFKGWDKSFTKVTGNMTVNAVWEKQAAKKQDTKNGEEKAEQKQDSKKSDQQQGQKQDPKQPGQKQEEQSDTADLKVFSGTIYSWDDDDSTEGENACDIINEDGSHVQLLIRSEFEAVPEEYIPEAGDTVTVTYDAVKMELYRIEVIQKHEENPGPDEQDQKEQPQEEQTEPEEQPQEEQTEPEEQPQEEQAEPEEQPQEEQAEPEEDTVTEEDILVTGKAIIIEGNEKERTVKVKMDENVVELKLDEKTTIASGYYPQKNDEVKIVYSKSDMTLRDIQLIRRAETAPAAEAGADGE